MPPWLFLILVYPYAYAQLNTTFIKDCLEQSSRSDGQSVTTVCTKRQEKSPITINESSNVTLRNCIFIGCGTIVAKSPVVLENITFDSAASSNAGAAVRIENTLATVTNTMFRTCSSRGQVAGGSMVITGQSSAIINSCTFFNNTSTDVATGGGAIYVDNGAMVNISDSQFINNTASIRGGSIYITGTVSRVYLNNIHFSGGRAISSRGGDIYVFQSQLEWYQGQSIGTLNQTTSGGSICVEAGSAILDSIEFRHHHVKLTGGTLYALMEANMTLRSVMISHSQAGEYGGAIAVLSSFLSAYNLTTRFTRAGNTGGSVYFEVDGVGEFQDFKALDSFAQVRGGCFADNINNHIRMNQFLFENCFTAEYSDYLLPAGGGGISTLSRMELENGTFKQCVSGLYGGGLAVISSPDPQTQQANVTLKQVTFIENTAKGLYGQGGGIYALHSNLNLIHVVFDSNKATYGGGALEVADIPSSRTSWTRVQGSLVMKGNASPLGGGILLWGYAAIHFQTSNLTMTDNSGSLYGSAIYSRQYFQNTTSGNQPEFLYQPLLSHAEPNIQGFIYFENSAFAESLHRVGQVYKMKANLESPPTSLVEESSEGYEVLYDLTIPTITMRPVSVFSTRNNTQLGTTVIGVKLVSEHTELTGILFKGISLSGVAKFNQLGLRNITPLFNGTITLKYYIVHSDSTLSHLSDQYSLYKQYNVTWCQSPQFQLVPWYKDAKGKQVFTCLPARSTQQNTRFILAAMSLVSIITAMGLGYFAHVNKAITVYRVNSPLFTDIITIGCILQLAAVMSLVQLDDISCMAFQWLESLGFVLVLGSIFLKTHRIRCIFMDTLKFRGKHQNLRDGALLRRLQLAILATCLFLSAWTALERLQVQSVRFGSEKGWIQTDRCSHSSSTLFPIVSLILHLMCEFIVAYSAFAARNIPSLYNETKSILLMAYSWIMTSGLFRTVAQFLALPPDEHVVILGLSVLLPSLTTVLLLHAPRAHLVMTDPELATCPSCSLEKEYPMSQDPNQPTDPSPQNEIPSNGTY